MLMNFEYTEISPPLIVNEDVMFGTGQLPKFEEDQFEIKFDNSDQRKFLIPTAEVVLTNLVRKSTMKEILYLKDLLHPHHVSEKKQEVMVRILKG